MELTYAHKMAILSHLSNPVHWANRFDMSFFNNETRRWKSDKYDGMTIHLNGDRTKAVVRNVHNGSVLTLEKLDGAVVITDEQDRAIVVKGKTIETSADVTIQDAALVTPSRADNDNKVIRAGLSDFGLYVGISNTGLKEVLVDAAGRKITLSGTRKKQQKPTPPGRFFHAIELTEHEAESLHLPVHDLMVGAKLIVALDMGLEPDINLINALDEKAYVADMVEAASVEYDMDWQGPSRWRPQLEKPAVKISLLQKAWTDVVDFTGHQVAAPMNFYVERLDDGYRLSVDFAARERIWGQGHILEKALGSDIPPIQTITPNTQPYALLQYMAGGHATTDHRGDEWGYAVVKTPQSKIIARAARASMAAQFGLSAQHFAIINFAEGLFLLAGNSTAIQNVLKKNKATLEKEAMLRMAALPPQDVLGRLTPTH